MNNNQPMCQAPDDSGYRVVATVTLSRHDGELYVGESRTFEVDTLTQSMARVVMANATKTLNEGGLAIALLVEETCGEDISMATAIKSKL